VYHVDGSNVTTAQAVAAKANVTVVFVSTTSGEGMDRSTLSLGATNDQLVAALAKATQKLIVFMVHPGSVLTPWRDSVAAIVASFMPGQEYGNAVTDLLFGEDSNGTAVSPSARLPLTFPNHDNEISFNTEQWPGTYESNGTGSCKPKHHCLDPSDNNCLLTKDDTNCHYSNYTEGLLVGYRYYAAKNITPAYCFGHGLAFVNFHYSSLPHARRRRLLSCTYSSLRTLGSHQYSSRAS
jgi:beta-glucosidase